MKKLLLVTIVLLMTQLCACSNKSDNTEAVKNNKSIEIQEIAMPQPFDVSQQDTGGDKNLVYYCTFNDKLNFISDNISSCIEQEKYTAWLNENASSTTDKTCIKEFANMYSFIHEFNVSDEIIRNYYTELREYRPENECLTDEEIDLLLSDDYVAVANHFVSENAIAKDGDIYSPKWLYEHSIQEYIENDLPLDVVNEKIKKIDSELTFPIDTREAIKLKLDAINQYAEAESKGYRINLKSAPIISDIDLSEPFDVTSDTNQLFGIEKSSKKYGLRWLAGKDISEYKNAGITTDELKTLLDNISEYKDTEEYGWIESCYNRMLSDSGVTLPVPDDGFGNYIYTINGYDFNVEWLFRNTVEEWKTAGVTASDAERILEDISGYKDTAEYKNIQEKYNQLSK